MWLVQHLSGSQHGDELFEYSSGFDFHPLQAALFLELLATLPEQQVILAEFCPQKVTEHATSPCAWRLKNCRANLPNLFNFFINVHKIQKFCLFISSFFTYYIWKKIYFDYWITFRSWIVISELLRSLSPNQWEAKPFDLQFEYLAYFSNSRYLWRNYQVSNSDRSAWRYFSHGTSKRTNNYFFLPHYYIYYLFYYTLIISITISLRSPFCEIDSYSY